MLQCPRCHRTNPEQAVFCHHDGAELRSVYSVAADRMPHEFVFPSGRRCRTFDELARGCQEEWADARDLLQQGRFAQFLASLGRMDLTRIAQEAQAQKDPDLGLNDFISRLPASQVAQPRLELRPRRIQLGPLRPGETLEMELIVANTGQGLLHGSIAVAGGCDWLTLANANGQGECVLRVTHQQVVTLSVRTQDLAAPQSYGAKLRVISNGGIVEVPVKLDLATYPFPRAPFQGVASPREMAERMRVNPKAGVPLLESGEVQRWFTANHWTYPVRGPTAKGVAAVQQFFEAMGTGEPPPVQLSQNEARFTCQQPEVARGQVVLRTATRKWVYAHVEADVPWIRPASDSISGPQQAPVTFEVDTSQLEGGQVHAGRLQFAANAGQILFLKVRVDVVAATEPVLRRMLRPFLAGAVVAFFARLLLAGGADLYARVLTAGAAAPQPIGGFAFWAEPPTDLSFIKHFIVMTWWLGAILGAILLWRRGSHWADVPCGTIAGAVAGLVVCGTLACVWPVLELPPRLVWRLAGTLLQPDQLGDSPWVWTPIWIALCLIWWTLLGMVGGFVLSLVQPGRRILTIAAEPLAAAFRLVGLKGLAAWFVLP